MPLKNLAARKLYAAAYYSRNKQARKAYQRQYRLAHSEESKAYQRAYYGANKSLILDQKKAWTAKHAPAGSTRQTYKALLQRCTNANYFKFHRYGGRLKPCMPENWRGRRGLKQMIDDVGERPSSAHTLHRPCVNKGYSKDNAVWSVDHSEPCKHPNQATPQQQRLNQRPTIQLKRAA